MLHVGLDLSRRRVDVCVLSGAGELVGQFPAPVDRDGLYGLTRRLGVFEEPLRGVVESMNGARFIHDELARCGWEVLVADAQKVKGLAPLACKTDKVDARVLAELSFRDLVPAIWLPSERLRAERELSRFRLHLVKHRTSLKNRIHATLITFGHQRPVSDLFGLKGRRLLEGLEIPEPWLGNVAASLALIDDLGSRIGAIEDQLRRSGADHPYVPLLLSVPGISWVLGYTIASELGEIERFATAKHLVSYTGLCPRVKQSGDSDLRGPLSKHGPRYLRWGLIEAAQTAARHPLYKERYQHTKRRLGKQRGSKIAQIDLARQLAEAIWHMLKRKQPFAPAGATKRLAA
ncbi:MAG: IS110 family transposase [Solirubrobacteraceae bacterium]